MKKNVKLTIKALIVSVSIIVFSSCNKDVSVYEYGAFLTDKSNGFHQETFKNGIKMNVIYQPLDYVIAKELSKSERTLEVIQAQKKDYEGMQYFIMELGAMDGSIKKQIESRVGEDGYEAKMEYYRFGMQSDMGLVYQKDTMKCTLYHLEQTGSITNKMRFLIGFKDDNKLEKNKFNSNLQMYYHDKVFSNDTLKFDFSKEKLNSAPNISL